MDCFLITTYGRKQSCQRLVDSLQGLGDILVVGDHTDYKIDNCQFYNLPVHNGKHRYFDTVNALWRGASGYQYSFMLPDDFSITPDFVDNAFRIWNEIADPRKICLNLYYDRSNLPCWTNVIPTRIGNVWHTQWVDMCFMAPKGFFLALKRLPVMRANWEEFPLRSSGVGSYISRTLHRRGYGLYQVAESLAVPTEAHYETQMHKL